MNLPLTPLRFLERANNLYGDKQGVICGSLRLTYAEFFDRCRRLAGALAGLGLQPGDRVAYLGYNCHRLLECYYGVLLAKGVLVPLNIRLSPADTAFILRDSGARILFLEPDFLLQAEATRSQTPGVNQVFLPDQTQARPSWVDSRSYDELLGDAPRARFDFMDVDENSAAELFYTSGTTGDPKGVVLTHRAIHLHTLNIMAVQYYPDTTVLLHSIPLFHANGWGSAHSVMAAGGTHVMLRRFDPERVCQLIEQEKVTCFCAVPTMASALVNYPGIANHDYQSMDWVHVGGAAATTDLLWELEEKLHCKCFGGYGLTETSPVLTRALLKDSLLHASAQEQMRYKATTGRSIIGVEVRLVDRTGNDVPRDGATIGEIVTRTDGMMEGYWGQPEETRAAFRDGWLLTGDMAVWDEHGYVLIVDRKKEIIISGGENISSLEIEKVLCGHPAVLECAAVAVPDEKWGEVPKALVVLKENSSATEEEMLAFLRQRIAKFKLPRSVEFLPELPKGGTGKILKKVLREKYWEGFIKRVH